MQAYMHALCPAVLFSCGQSALLTLLSLMLLGHFASASTRDHTMVHSHTVRLPLGALLIWRTVCGTGDHARVGGQGRAGIDARTARHVRAAPAPALTVK